MGNRLQDKVAVITGAASGMGKATAAKFIEEGARVVIADIQAEKGKALAKELGPDAAFIVADVCNEAEIKAAIDYAVDSFGRLDCLFNNAGFGGVNGNIEALDLGEPYRRTVDGMLTAVVAGMKHAEPPMKAGGGGSIISTASVAGLKGGYGPHVYSAVKAGVINLTRSVALELGPANIRVNAICPGGIATPIFAGQLALSGGNQDYAEMVKPALALMQPIPRPGVPEDIANTVCFLASDEASFISGQALAVDGGLTAGAWSHPSIAPDPMTIMSQLFGIDDLNEVDMVVPPRSQP